MFNGRITSHLYVNRPQSMDLSQPQFGRARGSVRYHHVTVLGSNYWPVLWRRQKERGHLRPALQQVKHSYNYRAGMG